LGQKPTNDRGRLPVMSSPKSIEKMLKRSMIDVEEELKGAKDDAIVESAEIVLYDMPVCSKHQTHPFVPEVWFLASLSNEHNVKDNRANSEASAIILSLE